MSPSMATVQLRDLRRRFGMTQALDGLSFDVAPGELFGLVGADGAGKTTALRAIAGLIKLDGGVVRVLDHAPEDRYVRERLGFMPQQYSLYGDLTVEQNLHFFGRVYVLRRAEYETRVKRLLDITRLARFVDRRADALSGGMYKKLALACALLHKPEVLIMDEPTNGVDPVSRRELWELLYEFVGTGMSVIISTPYMDEAERCHRVALLHHGRLLALGAVRELIASMRAEVFEVVGHDVDRAAVDALMARRPEVLSASPAGARLRLVLSEGAEATVAKVLEPLSAKLARVAPTFEDLFLARLSEEEAA